MNQAFVKEETVRLFLSFCLLMLIMLLFSSGCINTYQSSYQKITPHIPQPPPEDYKNIQTLDLVLKTEPPDAEIYAEDKKTKLGSSPMDLKINFCEYDGVVWFKNPSGFSDTEWFRMPKDLHNSGYISYGLYVGGQNFYRFYIITGIPGTLDGKYINISQNRQIPLTDGLRIQPIGFPLKLVKHGRIFNREFAQAINSDDYYGAEELRLRRIDELETILEQSSVYINKSLLVGGEAVVDKVEGKLIKSEIEQLKHTVGLLEPQLMSMRKQLVVKLQSGDIESAYTLAQAVAVMEKRYFPEPQPQQIIMQAPNQVSTQPSNQFQETHSQAKQEIVIQQKPYYGAQNIVEAIGAMQGNKLDPEAYKKALGGAKLLDIMGFADEFNK